MVEMLAKRTPNDNDVRGQQQLQRQNFRLANEQIRNETPEGKKPKQIKQSLTCYRNSRMNRLARVRSMLREQLDRHISLDR